MTVFTAHDPKSQARWGYYTMTDAKGKAVVTKTFSTAFNGLYDIRVLSTGGALVAGTAYSSNFVYNGWIVRINGAVRRDGVPAKNGRRRVLLPAAEHVRRGRVQVMSGRSRRRVQSYAIGRSS